MTTINLDGELDARLETVANALDRSKSWALEKAVRDFVEDQEWRIAVEEGIRDAEAGRTVEHAEVVAWIRSWGTDPELQQPTCD